MEKKRESRREPVLALVFLLVGVTALSWVGQHQGIADTTGYTPAVRGFTSEHANAWNERGDTISQRFSNPQQSSVAANIKSIGEVLQKTTNGVFIKLNTRQIIFVATTQIFSEGDIVAATYKKGTAGEIINPTIKKI